MRRSLLCAAVALAAAAAALLAAGADAAEAAEAMSTAVATPWSGPANWADSRDWWREQRYRELVKARQKATQVDYLVPDASERANAWNVYFPYGKVLAQAPANFSDNPLLQFAKDCVEALDKASQYVKYFRKAADFTRWGRAVLPGFSAALGQFSEMADKISAGITKVTKPLAQLAQAKNLVKSIKNLIDKTIPENFVDCDVKCMKEWLGAVRSFGKELSPYVDWLKSSFLKTVKLGEDLGGVAARGFLVVSYIQVMVSGSLNLLDAGLTNVRAYYENQRKRMNEIFPGEFPSDAEVAYEKMKQKMAENNDEIWHSCQTYIICHCLLDPNDVSKSLEEQQCLDDEKQTMKVLDANPYDYPGQCHTWCSHPATPEPPEPFVDASEQVAQAIKNDNEAMIKAQMNKISASQIQKWTLRDLKSDLWMKGKRAEHIKIWKKDLEEFYDGTLPCWNCLKASKSTFRVKPKGAKESQTLPTPLTKTNDKVSSDEMYCLMSLDDKRPRCYNILNQWLQPIDWAMMPIVRPPSADMAIAMGFIDYSEEYEAFLFAVSVLQPYPKKLKYDCPGTHKVCVCDPYIQDPEGTLLAHVPKQEVEKCVTDEEYENLQIYVRKPNYVQFHDGPCRGMCRGREAMDPAFVSKSEEDLQKEWKAKFIAEQAKIFSGGCTGTLIPFCLCYRAVLGTDLAPWRELPTCVLKKDWDDFQAQGRPAKPKKDDVKRFAAFAGVPSYPGYCTGTCPAIKVNLQKPLDLFIPRDKDKRKKNPKRH